MDADIASLERRVNAEPENVLLLNRLRRQEERIGGDSVAILKRYGQRNGQSLFCLVQLAKDQQIPHVEVNGRLLIRWFRSFEDSLQIHGQASKARAAIRNAGLASVPGLVILLNHPVSLVRKSAALVLDDIVASEFFDTRYLSDTGYQKRLLKIYLEMDIRVRGKPIARWLQSFESSIAAGGNGGRAARALGELGRAAMPRMRELFESNDTDFQCGSLAFYATLHPEIRGLPELFYNRAGIPIEDRYRQYNHGIHEVPELSALNRRIWAMAETNAVFAVRLYVEVYRRNSWGRWQLRQRLKQYSRGRDQARRALEAYLSDRDSSVRALVEDVLSPRH